MVQMLSHCISGSYSKSDTKKCACCSLVNIKENEHSFIGNWALYFTLHGNDITGAPAQDEN